MKDEQGSVIYVGKSNALKKRVRSYFNGTHDFKTKQLVNQVVDFEIIMTSSNLEALILEMNLIKKYNPKYNIRLKDDKNYPYIKITSERNPRLIITRGVLKDQGKYFGPFPNVQAAIETKKLLDHLYPLRKCSISGKRPCINYQLGLCIGTCVREVNEIEYQKVIDSIVSFFHGGYKRVKKELKREMYEAAKGYDYERAQKLRDQITYIEATMEKQIITTIDGADRDVFGYYSTKNQICIQVFHIRQGKLIDRNVSIFQIYDEPESAFFTYLGQFYFVNSNTRPKEVIIPENVDKDLVQALLNIKTLQPKRGQKKELVRLACRNARISLEEKLNIMKLGQSMD